MIIEFSEIKSLRDATTEEVQKVFKRYDKMSGMHEKKSDKVNEVYLSQQAIQNVEIKSCDLESKELAELCEQRGIKFDEKYKGRVKVYKASDETVDSAGDIIRQDGWDFSRFKTNPAIQYCHDYYNLPIGSGIKWQVKDKALYIHVLFATKEQNEFADTVFNMVDGGFLKGNSVGFSPKKVQIVEDQAERNRLGLGKWGVIFEKSLLLEDSVCPLGCNPAALVQEAFANSMCKGIVTLDEAERFIKSDSIPDTLKESIDRAVTQYNKSIAVTGSEIPEQQTTFDSVLENIKAIEQKVVDGLEKFEKQIDEIKADTANIREKVLSDGAGGNSPEPDTKSESDYYDMVLGELKDINSTFTKGK